MTRAKSQKEIQEAREILKPVVGADRKLTHCRPFC